MEETHFNLYVSCLLSLTGLLFKDLGSLFTVSYHNSFFIKSQSKIYNNLPLIKLLLFEFVQLVFRSLQVKALYVQYTHLYADV